jgi:hypothetical protein
MITLAWIQRNCRDYACDSEAGNNKMCCDSHESRCTKLNVTPIIEARTEACVKKLHISANTAPVLLLVVYLIVLYTTTSSSTDADLRNQTLHL